LAALPSPDNPEQAEEYQKRIRESRIRTAQLTGALADAQIKQQEQLRADALRAIEEQGKASENAAQRIEQAQAIASQSIERQNKLLDAQRSLQQSIVGLQDTESKILLETEKDEAKKAKIQERAAEMRLKALRDAQAIEERILELQLQQEQAQANIAIAQAATNLQKAQIDQQAVEADPNAAEGDRTKAALGVQGAGIELAGALQAAELAGQLADTKRQQFGVDARKAVLEARLELAQSRTDPDRRDRELAQLRGEARRGLSRPQSARVSPTGDTPSADYSQVDSARRQLGVGADDPRLGKLSPVNLHGGTTGLGAQLGAALGQLSQQLDLAPILQRMDRLLSTNTSLSTQILGLASRRPLVQKITQNNQRQTPPVGSGLAI
jgi:hypothetical protein